MDFKIRITEAALADLEEFLDYSWANFPDTAERFGNALLNHVDLLQRFPRLGAPVRHRHGIRKILHTPVRIYYRLWEDQKLVEVLHFWHVSRRDPRW